MIPLRIGTMLTTITLARGSICVLIVRFCNKFACTVSVRPLIITLSLDLVLGETRLYPKRKGIFSWL